MLSKFPKGDALKIIANIHLTTKPDISIVGLKCKSAADIKTYIIYSYIKRKD